MMVSEIDKGPPYQLPYPANKNIEYSVQFEFQIYSKSLLSVSAFHATCKSQFLKIIHCLFEIQITLEFYLEILQEEMVRQSAGLTLNHWTRDTSYFPTIAKLKNVKPKVAGWYLLFNMWKVGLGMKSSQSIAAPRF